jgi:hypothetical protein
MDPIPRYTPAPLLLPLNSIVSQLGVAAPSVGFGRRHHDPSQLARLVVRSLPGLGKEIVIPAWRALHDQLRLVLGHAVDGVVDGSEFRA